MPAPERLSQRCGLTPEEVLAEGELTVVGRIPQASNAVLYATVSLGDSSLDCVYKPVAGERPLWDFPTGSLARREVAAYEVCRALGWDLVPPTVLRQGPHGEGMCQLWVGPAPGEAEEARSLTDIGSTLGVGSPTGEAEDESPQAKPLLALVDATEPEPGWKAIGFAAVPEESGEERTALLVHADDELLRRTAVLDAVINNADRKGGHLLPLPGGELRVIDHGVCFHTDNKLRTLLWGWAGEPLNAEAITALRRLAASLVEDGPLIRLLAGLLREVELQALRKRTETLLTSGHHPLPTGDWPAIPWPPM